MELYEINPVLSQFNAGYGNVVEYSIIAVSDIEYADRTDYPGLVRTIRKEIAERLIRNEPQGCFSTSAYVAKEGKDPLTILTVRVSYLTIPDYEIFRRIFAWWYNYDVPEALSESDFRNAYGENTGSHIFSIWKIVNYDITSMVGYLGNDQGKGQKFLSMIMNHVQQFEQNLFKAERK